MRYVTRVLAFTALSLFAQTPGDPSGHWETTLQIEGQDLKLEFDLGSNPKGEPIGTLGQPAQGVKGLPLLRVALDGRAVSFAIKSDTQTTTFAGEVSADGKSITGKFSVGEHSIAATLTRTGNPIFAAAPKSPALRKDLEGVWNGVLDAGGNQMRVVLRMANQPDGTASGTVFSADGSGVEIPIVIQHKASSLTIQVPSIGATYAATLNVDAAELTGEWKQHSMTLPLKLRRAR